MANRFLDRTNKSGDLSGTWTFTNGSAAVAGSGGNAQTLGLGAGDYVKPNGTNEWYRIASVGGEDSITLDYNFVQATQSSVVANYADVSVNDGTDASKAFVHLLQYTTDEIRSAGDVLYCRRGQTHLNEAVDITDDENGAVGNYITVVADDGTYWVGEGGNADPILDFNGADICWVANSNYWKWEEITFHDGHDAYGMVEYANFGYFLNCTFDEGSNTFGALFSYGSPYLKLENCAFTNNGVGMVIYMSSRHIYLRSCSFDGNTVGFRIQAYYGYNILLEECAFGESTENTVDVNFSSTVSGHALFKGCNLASTTPLSGVSEISYASSIIFVDGENVKNKSVAYYGEGKVERETTVVRSGGADTSLKCAPTDKCDDDARWPLICYEAWIYNAGAEKTYTVYMYADGTWAALPTSAQLYLEAAYFDQGGDAGRATVVSNDAISSEETWTVFDVTCTPVAAGPVRLRVYLKKYEADKLIYIDPLVVVS